LFFLGRVSHFCRGWHWTMILLHLPPGTTAMHSYAWPPALRSFGGHFSWV
jgi:hypothetical protein